MNPGRRIHHGCGVLRCCCVRFLLSPGGIQDRARRPKGGGGTRGSGGGCMLSDATYTPPVPHTRSERNHPASSGISRPDTASTFRDVTLESSVFAAGAGKLAGQRDADGCRSRGPPAPRRRAPTGSPARPSRFRTPDSHPAGGTVVAVVTVTAPVGRASVVVAARAAGRTRSWLRYGDLVPYRGIP